ncbi:putative disease resistance protein [Prunus yedoensis var. nudiflora]|uniref:Putative disease resistance protein n=1 Tax=Prunus yedoensis var. nudiflora TaxID=2094558 RepID=A0A314UMY5_PRUYE|nr:putative disease resistance protein [Prunus yedoensis var. nudiflora]
MKMLRHCAGLPLAIIVLAGVLARKNTVREWERVHENVYEYIRKGIGHEEEYEGHYPEDFEFWVSKLTKLWVAEGLISLRQQRHGSRETMEDIARDWLSELVERCLVQVGTSGSTGTIKGCRIHDLVRDMCLLKAEEESFLHINNSLQENTSSMAATATQLGKIRRLAIYLDEKADRLVSSRDETNGHVRLYLHGHPKCDKEDETIKTFIFTQEYRAKGKLELSTLGHLQTLYNLSSEYCDLKDVGRLTNLRKLRIKSVKLFAKSGGNLKIYKQQA